MKVGFAGMGNMGSTIANLVAGNGHTVAGWDHDPAVVDEINTAHTNARYLKGISLDRSITAHHELKETMEKAEVFFIALPSVYIKTALDPFRNALPPSAVVVNLAKGIDGTSGNTSFRILQGIFPGNQCAMLSGPSIANEIARRMPTVTVLAGKDRQALMLVAGILENEYFKISFSDDETGVELGGILKNMYAIALGIFDGLSVRSVNFRSVFLTLALDEMIRTGVRLGAKAGTFSYIAGVGDLFATSLSEHSHNRRMGELLARGKSLAQIRKAMGILPEGYNTLKVMLGIAQERGIPMPVARDLNEVIEKRMMPEQFIHSVITEERVSYEISPGD